MIVTEIGCGKAGCETGATQRLQVTDADGETYDLAVCDQHAMEFRRLMSVLGGVLVLERRMVN